MNQIAREVIIAVTTAVIVGIGGYALTIHRATIDIEYIQATLAELKDSVDEIDDNLNSTRLIVAQAHPNQYPAYVTELRKIENLSTDELSALANDLEAGELQFDANNELVEAPESLTIIADKYDLNQRDLAAYSQIIEAPLDGL